MNVFGVNIGQGLGLGIAGGLTKALEKKLIGQTVDSLGKKVALGQLSGTELTQYLVAKGIDVTVEVGVTVTGI